MNQRRQYKHPPIEEAICEFRFAPGSEWNLTIPGLYFEQVKQFYGGKLREQKALAIQANTEQKTPGQGTSLLLREEDLRLQIPTEDGKALVSVGRDVLSVHVLKPYPGWEEFRNKIAFALAKYIGVAMPTGIRKIGVRYINVVTFQGSVGDIAALFDTPPVALTSLNCTIENFFHRNEYIYADEPIRAAVTFARSVAQSEHTACILDIDVSRDWPGQPLANDDAMALVTSIRDRERDVFEALVTEKAREIFDAA